MDYRNECVYYQVCIDKGCPCALVNHEVKDKYVYKEFLEALEQEHGAFPRPL